MSSPVLIDDVLILVLEIVDQRTLYSCLFVSRSMYEIVLRKLWRSPRFKKYQDILVFRKCLQARPRFGRYVKELCFKNIVQCNFLDDNLLTSLIKSCNCLTKLDLSFAGMITDTALMVVSQHCPQLNHICLRECRTLTNDSIGAIVKNCKQLVSLNFSRCLSITPSVFEDLITRHRDHVKKLDLTFCKWVRDDTASLISQFGSLRKLILTNCVEITSNFMINLAPNVPHLRALHLGWVLNITDDGVIQIVDHCPKLRVLVLCGCNIHDETLHHIAKKLKMLAKLDVSFCTNLSDDVLRMFNIAELRYGDSGSLQKETMKSFQSDHRHLM
ncbi:15621_t:CDS:1 [Acaulospora morrowiae]|uniref:15621_t:CDS:1 n=1 Tax=Acaulospora morrowiae TaxID=94023 RepID=A0A9N8VYK8_9GLOM|nr:15621_t:CDS:1 [Acaulospora morrowiae]